MAIITLSRGSYSHGEEIARRVAARLGYEYTSREILVEASRFFDVSEMRLTKTIHDAPSILERITRGKEKYLNYIQAALLEHVRRDNVVYHGHAGHFFLPRISHVARVRIIADMSERVRYLREVKPMSEAAAKDYLINEDRERTRWTRYLFDKEITDPALYDLVINIGVLNIDDACDIICTMAESERFKATPESTRAINDLAISSHIRAALQETCEADVTSEAGRVHVRVLAPKIRKSSYASPYLEKSIAEDMRQELNRKVLTILKDVSGVKDVTCAVDDPLYL
jgi:cytidylate kinase